MNEWEFRLVGFDSPTGSFPGPVIPVGQLGDDFVAAYENAQGICEFVRLSVEARYWPVRNGHFEAQDVIINYRLTEELFAFNPNVLVSYDRSDTEQFYSLLLAKETFIASNPFLRLTLAERSRSAAAISNEMARCVNYLREEDRSFVEAWYDATFRSLNSAGLLKGIGDMPWSALRTSQSSSQRKAILITPEYSFGGETQSVFQALTMSGVTVDMVPISALRGQLQEPQLPYGVHPFRLLQYAWNADTILVFSDRFSGVVVMDYERRRSVIPGLENRGRLGSDSYGVFGKMSPFRCLDVFRLQCERVLHIDDETFLSAL